MTKGKALKAMPMSLKDPKTEATNSKILQTPLVMTKANVLEGLRDGGGEPGTLSA